MAFIIPFNEKLLNTNTYNKLPIELINHVFSFGDVCSYIITIGNNCIKIHDFYSILSLPFFTPFYIYAI